MGTSLIRGVLFFTTYTDFLTAYEFFNCNFKDNCIINLTRKGGVESEG